MKILYISTVGSTMYFFMDYIRKLLDKGHTVDLACNSSESGLPDCYREWGCGTYQLDCSRIPLYIGNLTAVGQICKLVAEKNYDIVHCHTPIAAACTRMACIKYRSKGTKVFYTAHGFHFFKKGPVAGWMLYFPVEWLLGFQTDVLITINREDYRCAKKHLHAKKIYYVPGVGIERRDFSGNRMNAEKKRTELGLSVSNIMLLSVGELNKNKNHELVVRALAVLNHPDIRYYIAGKGELEGYLQSLIFSLNLQNNVKILGHRTDIKELCQAADLFILPSRREGLPVALMEAIACHTPVVCSDIRGCSDLVTDPSYRFPCDSMESLIRVLRDKIGDGREETGKNTRKAVTKMYEYLKKYDRIAVEKKMNAIYTLYEPEHL